MDAHLEGGARLEGGGAVSDREPLGLLALECLECSSQLGLLQTTSRPRVSQEQKKAIL